jgi:hypothetical protein
LLLLLLVVVVNKKKGNDKIEKSFHPGFSLVSNLHSPSSSSSLVARRCTR